MENDIERYESWLDGDKAAFEEIVLRHRAGLIRFIDRYVRDEYSAEDISMDVFVYILMNPRKYDFRVPLKTYLYMLGRSRAIDYLRRRRIVASFDCGEYPEAISTDSQPEQKVIDSEHSAALRKGMASLSEESRTALWLVYDEEMSYTEAAAVMRVSPKKVDNLVSRAKKRLKEQLGGDFIN